MNLSTDWDDLIWKIFWFWKFLDHWQAPPRFSSSCPWNFQGCWAGHHPCLGLVQWSSRWGKPIWGFTPVCTMAKNWQWPQLPIFSQYQRTPDSNLHHNWGILVIITSQCYIKKVSAESVCLTSHFRMVSDSVSNSPGPGWPDWLTWKWDLERSCHVNWKPYKVLE